MKFTKTFKQKAIELKESGIHPNTIFQDNGYSIKGKQKDYTSKLISRWRKSISKAKIKDTKKRIEYLEAQVIYLKAENSFLAKLPKKKKN